MKIKFLCFFQALVLSTSGCSTLNESLQLGAGMGALAGAAASHAAQSTGDGKPDSDRVAGAAAIGLLIGLITSNAVHGKVAEDRQFDAQQTEIYFGDLPPSPFVLPHSSTKKGSR